MKLFGKECSTVALATAGLVLLFLHQSSCEELRTLRHPRSTDSDEQKYTLPADYITDPVHVSYPWLGDPTCQHFPVQFARNHTRPKWALTSFPGSGVTWTRQLIEGVTGIYTGSVYGRKEQPIVLTGEYFGSSANLGCECTILIKDHDITHPAPVHPTVIGKNRRVKKKGSVRSSTYGNRGVLLLRNPIDAMFSYAHFLATSKNHTGVVSEKDFSGPQWDEFVDYAATTWADHAVGWIETIQKGTVLFYERLLSEDTAAELKRLLDAIDFSDPHRPPVDAERLRCTLQHKNRTDRKRAKKPIVPLTADQQKKFESSIERVQKSLRKKGWPLLPVELYYTN